MNNRLIVLENKVNTLNHKNDEIFIYDDRKSIEQNLLEAKRFFLIEILNKGLKI